MGKRGGAGIILQKAMAWRVPGDKFDLKRYDLLAAAPESPPGLEELRWLLETALNEEDS